MTRRDSDLTAHGEDHHSDTLLAEGSHAPTVDGRGSPVVEHAAANSLEPVGDDLAGLPIVDRDNYVIEAPFAKGGIGKISAAHDRRLDRRVAIKELRRSSRYARMRFVREIRITAKLQHPNIVPIHEAGRWPDGEPFFAMTLVEGDSLEGAITSCVTREDHLQLVRHVSDVADAMAHAHSRRIVHRDLKPGNVLVGPFGETVVIDWGLAKDLSDVDDVDEDMPTLPDNSTPDRYATTRGVVLGTPSYMPPEQAAGEKVDERADVYALGAIMYQALSGAAPYNEYHPKRVLERVGIAPPTPLSELDPSLPKDLIAIVAKAMARKPDDRYPSAALMADELRSFTHGRLVSAYSYSFADLARRFLLRYRAAVATAVVGLLVLLSFGAWSFRRLSRARDIAEEAQHQEAEARALEELARAAAERRLDEAVLAAARHDLTEDPTKAVARLKQLGVMIEGTASVAADAEERGVARLVLRGHKDRVDVVAYSPDGQLVASSGTDGVIRVLVRDTQKTLLLEKHRARVPALAFVGDLLVSADYDGEIVVWDARTGAVRSSTVGHATSKVRAMVVHDQLVATISEDDVRVWDVSSGKAALAFEHLVSGGAFVRFVADHRLATGSHDGELHLWDLKGDDHRVLKGHTGEVFGAAISHDGNTLVSVGEDGDVRRWDLLREGSTVLGRHERGALVVQMLDDTRVVTGGMDGRVVVWNLASGQSTPVAEHAERVTALAVYGGRWIASGGWDEKCMLTDAGVAGSAPGARYTQRTFRGHDGVISSLAFAVDGTELASGSWDTTVRLWPTRTDARRFQGHDVGVKTVAIDRAGKHLASGGHDNLVKLWDIETGTLLRTLAGHEDHVFRVLFSPDGAQIASSSDDRTVRLWSVADGTERVFSGHTADVEELAFSNDGRWLASAGEDGGVGLWPLEAEAKGHVLRVHEAPVSAVVFNEASDTLVSGSLDGTVVLWDLPQGTVRHRQKLHVGGVTALSMSVTGLVASTGRDGQVLLWDMATPPRRVTSMNGADRVTITDDGTLLAASTSAGRIALCTLGPSPTCRWLVGHDERVHALRFTANHAMLVSGSEDGTVRMWSTATGESRPIRIHNAPVFDVALQGDTVASASGDRTIGLFRLAPPAPPEAVRSELSRITSMELVQPADRSVF